MSDRTLEGTPLSAGISGFTTISTERLDAPCSPPPVLSPTDLLDQLSKLQSILSTVELERGLKLLFTHVHDMDNPHHTDLDQFTMQVVDVLYKEYKKQGGVGTKEFYTQSLFKVLRIATLEEMKSSTDTGLLISVKGAKLFIADHENDPSAHAAIFDRILPGEPVVADPAYALHSIFGVSIDLLKYLEGKNESAVEVRPYSFVGADGCVAYCTDPTDLPSDYQLGEPLIPCFGKRINTITSSNNFQLRSPTNTTIRKNATTAPDRSATAVAVGSNKDHFVCEHTLSYKDIELMLDETQTFSVFAKADQCRYLSISWKDMTTSIIMVRAIYDLQTGDHLLMNHMNRYGANIYRLANGWFRCEFNMYHPIGQKTDLILTFFKEKKDTRDETAFKFQGTGEVCGYLWGAQLEVGPNASPYIPTTGKLGVRYPIEISTQLPDNFVVSPANTISATYLNPKRYLDKNSIRPLITILDDQKLMAFTSRYTRLGGLDIARYETISAGGISLAAMVYQDLFDPTATTYCQFSHGIDTMTVLTGYQDRDATVSSPPKNWNKGSRVYIGNDGCGNFFEGYFRSLLLYPVGITKAQARFLNGEEIYG